jgi:hypothetical protein
MLHSHRQRQSIEATRRVDPGVADPGFNRDLAHWATLGDRKARKALVQLVAQGNLQVPAVDQAFHRMAQKFLTCQGLSRTRISSINDNFDLALVRKIY